MSQLSNLACHMSRLWCQRKEEIIKYAVTRALGREEWTMQEIAGRGRFVRIHGQTWETLMFDDKPVAVIHDLRW